MEGDGEFQDWELLSHSSDTALPHSDFQEERLDGDSEGMIRFDYFSIDSDNRYVKTVDVSEEGSVDSDNPSWIDPAPDNRYGRKNSRELWSDSSSDRSVEHRIGDFDTKNELGLMGIEEMKSLLGVHGDEGELGVRSELGLVEKGGNEVGYEGFREIKSKDRDLGRLWSHSEGDVLVARQIEMVSGDYTEGGDGLGLSGRLEGGSGSDMEFGGGEERSEDGSEDGEIVATKSDAKSVDVGEKRRRVIWWKVPLEFLKYCAFRVNPVWSFSMAAALMGFIILARRLSKMKRKTHSLQLKVTMDEKKVSLFKSRAAHLNEAFSVVRQVPIIIRPSHPAPGMTSWPMMSLR